MRGRKQGDRIMNVGAIKDPVIAFYSAIVTQALEDSDINEELIVSERKRKYAREVREDAKRWLEGIESIMGIRTEYYIERYAKYGTFHKPKVGVEICQENNGDLCM